MGMDDFQVVNFLILYNYVYIHNMYIILDTYSHIVIRVNDYHTFPCGLFSLLS